MFYVVVYVLLSLSYSFHLKDYPIVDIFCISSGFLLRLMAGGYVFNVIVSEWLFLCVFLLSIFLSAGKRLSEKIYQTKSDIICRNVLIKYPDGFLDGLLYMTGASVLVTYSIYVINKHSLLLLYTVPLCSFGLFRYILRVKNGVSGDPTESLTKDVPLFIVGLLWFLAVAWGIYG